MYPYTAFDQEFIRLRAAQFRDQLQRWQAGQLSDEQFLPLRLQNGWYMQRHAPMLRVDVPYGEIRLDFLEKVERGENDVARYNIIVESPGFSTKKVLKFPYLRLKITRIPSFSPSCKK